MQYQAEFLCENKPTLHIYKKTFNTYIRDCVQSVCVDNYRGRACLKWKKKKKEKINLKTWNSLILKYPYLYIKLEV